ncbi:MAG: hypothetical protein EZS26_001048 [Candidatus Ordinivivax streblomastigis]|uniref:Uncharacterized protein n=1 Tax=Candidatus Ordinivivax streblomastigis TaxID=2540710 RepID=A0A5M8P3B9_9BACT|nr:MAG: hypothetical protein EZS26_001048 [Candidatus Ordinivivax streblomastigis]
MAKELIARGQATIHTQKDAYTINQSVGEYVFSATNDANIASDVSFTSTIKVTLGDTNSTDFTIGTITKPAGFSSITVNNTNKTITYAVAANTANLADNGIITIPVIIKGETYSVSFVWSKTKSGNPGQDGYTVNASRQSYVVSTDKDGKIHTAVTTTTIISAFKGSTAITPTIGTLPSVAGCTLSKSGTTVTIIFNTGTSLAENGMIDIPVTVDGKIFTISFAYAKARTGATGDAGVDANILDWVADWNTNKTVIGQDSVITPKIFAGVKNSNGTLTGIALGRFSLSTLNTSGQIITETIDGIYGFKDGNKTFFVDNGGNAQLGRGNQFVKYNAATGKIEFGSEVSLNWAGATYIDANGIFTGTLSANTVNALNINASQITAGTINAARIDVASLKASLITAANIEAVTLNVTKGTIGGWTIDTDSIFLGTKNNTSGASTAASGAMTIGSTGIRGFKWHLDATGAGAVAGGNISWDAAGNVTFASSVSLNWTTPINGITTALGGSFYPKLTQISSTGIYTGTLTAAQVNAVSIDAGSIQTGILCADRIAAGSITATQLDAASIQAYIINVDYINGLECAFTQGTIGGWSMDSESISSATHGIENEAFIQIRSVASGSGYWYNGEYNPYGLVMTWNNQERGIIIGEQRISSDIIVIPRLRGNAGHFSFGEIAETSDTVKNGFIGIQMMGADSTEYFCLSANTLSGYTEIYNRIAGWGFDDSSIWKNNVSLGSDGSIRNGSKWQLNDDGSGRVANGNILWDASGNVTFASSVSLNWTNPINTITSALGGASYPKLTQITSTGIYTGTLNASQITAGTVSADRIAVGSISADKLDAASIKANIINTDYINGLSCTFAKGTIGGWTITNDTIYNVTNNQYFILRTNEASGSGAPSSYARRGLTLYMEDVSIEAGAVKIVQMGVLGSINATQSYPATPNYGFRIALKGGKDVFRADNTGAIIAGWNFDADSIFKGTKANTSGAYTSASGYITMGANGIRGYKWRLDATGAGTVAGGNIAWDASGNVTFGSSVSLNWINYTDNKVNALDTDGRNYALDTSNNYTNYVSLTNSLNQCILIYQVNARNWKAGDVIVVSFDYYFSNLAFNSSQTSISIQGSGDVTGWNPGFNGYLISDKLALATTGSIHLSYSVVITAEQARNNTFTLNVRHDYLSGIVSLRNLKVEKNKETGWSPAPEDIGNRLTKITSTGIYTGTITANQINIDSTLVVGGSTYNGSISVRDASNSVKATLDRTGITAVGGTIGGWTIASNQISKNSVVLSADGSITNGNKWKLNNDGSGQVANGNISWTASGTVTVTGTINATAGQIGGFEIGYGRIGSTASGMDGGGLAIYDDLFRVGSTTSYVLWGDNTFPSTSGSYSSGRISNNKSNYYGNNYGIYIDVTGGRRNLGIYSNAVIMAPSVIGNKVKTIAFSGSGYSIDFSQCNVFFIYGTSNYGVTLPSEANVADMFGYSTLPADFGFVFTLIYNYNYGNKLTINDLRNNNGSLANIAMEKGDSLTVLCSKFPAFHYQVIHRNST